MRVRKGGLVWADRVEREKERQTDREREREREREGETERVSSWGSIQAP